MSLSPAPTPNEPEVFLHVIKEARVANADALAKLGKAFEQHPNVLSDTFWQTQLDDDKTIHLIRANALAERKGEFWGAMLCAMRELAESVLGGDYMCWSAISLDESSRIHEEGTLALRHSIVCYTTEGKPGKEGFDWSLSKDFFDQRSEKLRTTDSENLDIESFGFGICATPTPIPGAKPFRQLLFIHADEPNFVFSGEPPTDGGQVQVLETFVGKLPRNGKTIWETYLAAYTHLFSADRDLHCHLSATTIFHGFHRGGGQAHQAVSQLVIGLDKIPSFDQARLLYNAVQMLQMGIAPLYSSMRRTLREMEALRQYKRMIERVAPPLQRLSEALKDVQSDTQKLRAILFDPAKSLFRLHNELSDLFQEDGRVEELGRVKVTIRHDCSYSGEQLEIHGRVILATALCRIFGRSKELMEEPDHRCIVARAQAVIQQCSGSEAFRELVEDLEFLFEVKRDAGENLGTLLDKNASSPLLCLKHALFDPFKLETQEWWPVALRLAVRSFMSRDATLPSSATHHTMEPGWSPISYHTLLTFVMDFAATMRYGEATEVRELKWDGEGSKRRVLAIRFSQARLRRHGFESLKELINTHILRMPMDWRIVESNEGNFRKPFFDLANRILGLKADGADGDDEAGKWKQEEVGKDDLIVVSRTNSPHERRIFRVSGLRRGAAASDAPYEGVEIAWEDVEIRAAECSQIEQHATADGGMGMNLLIGSAGGMMPSSTVKGSLRTGRSRPIEREAVAATTMPEAAAVDKRLFLCDHKKTSPDSTTWADTLSELGIGLKASDVFNDYPQQISANNPLASPNAVVFLHSIDHRGQWEKAFKGSEPVCKGHLVNVSRQGMTDGGGSNDDKIHECIWKPQEFSDDRRPEVLEVWRTQMLSVGSEQVPWILLGNMPSVRWLGVGDVPKHDAAVEHFRRYFGALGEKEAQTCALLLEELETARGADDSTKIKEVKSKLGELVKCVTTPPNAT